MTDPRNLFDFPDYTTYSPEQASKALAEHPDLYINHLTLAAHLDQWADRVENPSSPQMFGFVDALRDVSAHLRQADYMPESDKFKTLFTEE